MTEADHADLSRRLALAIGYAPENVCLRTQDDSTQCGVRRIYGGVPFWVEFDYRDPTVIWPIAERYNCFPMRSAWNGAWSASMYDDLSDLGKVVCDTAAEAVARAVIGAHE